MSDEDTLTHDITIGRQQCPDCQLWTDIKRFTIVDGELRCLRCAADDDPEPWFKQCAVEADGA